MAEAWLRRDWIAPGMALIEQGGMTRALYVLKDGELEVVRDGQYVATIKTPGAVIGEMSVLLELPQSATVQALTEVEYFIIDNAIEVLRTHPDWLLQIARLLAQRVNSTTALLTREKLNEDKDILVLSQQFMSSWGDPHDMSEAKPHLSITYCTQCNWLLRAAWMAQEVLSTFSLEMGEVSLVPGTGGIFEIHLDGTLIWERKRDGGFPDAKQIKQMVRDRIDPGRDLGHIDHKHGPAAPKFGKAGG